MQTDYMLLKACLHTRITPFFKWVSVCWIENSGRLNYSPGSSPLSSHFLPFTVLPTGGGIVPITWDFLWTKRFGRSNTYKLEIYLKYFDFVMRTTCSTTPLVLQVQGEQTHRSIPDQPWSLEPSPAGLISRPMGQNK